MGRQTSLALIRGHTLGALVGCCIALVTERPQALRLAGQIIKLSSVEGKFGVQPPGIGTAGVRPHSDHHGNVTTIINGQLNPKFSLERLPHLRPLPTSPVLGSASKEPRNPGTVCVRANSERRRVIVRHHRHPERVTLDV